MLLSKKNVLCPPPPLKTYVHVLQKVQITNYTKIRNMNSHVHVPVRPPYKSAYLKIILLISQPKHMLWVLKRTVSMRRFF